MRRTTRQWDGAIEALRVAAGRVPDERLNAEPGKWQNGLFVWRATDAPSPRFTWNGVEGESLTNAPRRQAMADLCQTLLNSNEFFYLH